MKSFILKTCLLLCCFVALSFNSAKAVTIYVNTFTLIVTDPNYTLGDTYKAYIYIENSDGAFSSVQIRDVSYGTNTIPQLTFYYVPEADYYRLYIRILKNNNFFMSNVGISDWQTAYAISVKVSPDPIRAGG